MTAILWGVIINVWSALLIAQAAARKRGLVPGRQLRTTVMSHSTVDIVIPVRNEAEELRSCVEQLLNQDYIQFNVTIVDDRSEDQTAAIAETLVATDRRVRLLRVEEQLPAGWLGKSHALQYAADQCEADWLLFIDADCRLDADAVRTAVGEAEAANADMLTWWPRHRGGSFWEHMLIPLCGAVIAMWFGWRGLRKPEASGFGNGQFFMVRREAYQRMGGHATVRAAMIEDVPFAEAAEAAGLRCRASSGRDHVSVRMYCGFRGICNGWARIFTGALRDGWKLLASVVWLAAGSLTPFVVLPILIACDLTWSLWMLMCVAHFVLMMAVSIRFWGYGRCDRRYLWLYPVSVVIVIGILLRAWWWLEVTRQVPWRGRWYRIDRHAKINLGVDH